MLANMEPVALLAALVVLAFAGASFFLSLAETSLFSLSKWQARLLAERHPAASRQLLSLMSKPHDVLAAMVLSNMVAGAAMVATVFWMAIHSLWPPVPAVVSLVLLVLIGCEVLPKTLAVRRPEQWALRVARPMTWLLAMSRPVFSLAQAINTAVLRTIRIRAAQTNAGATDADYRELLEMAYQQGALAQSEKEIILQIISLDRRTAREVMKPRAQMIAISDDLSIEEMIDVAKTHKVRRLPIFDETPDTIVGVLNTRALLLDPSIDLAEVIEFPSFVPESMNLLHLLKSLQRQQRGMAIVLDEFGGTDGIVTVGDILEEVIGHIRGETESQGFVMEKVGPGKWHVSGTLRLDDFRREYPALGDIPEVETMGGLLMSLLDVVPQAGESAVFRGLKLTAKATDERRVRELIVERVK